MRLLISLIIIACVLAAPEDYLFPNSTLVPTLSQRIMLNWFVNTSLPINNATAAWFPCFSGNLSSWQAAPFHAGCDFKGPHLIIARSEAGYTFGGFSNLNQNSYSTTRLDPNSFVFIISNPSRSPMNKYIPGSNSVSGQIITCQTCGAQFGNDMIIRPYSSMSSSNVGHAFNFGAAISFGTTVAMTFVAGLNSFRTMTFEAYILSFQTEFLTILQKDLVLDWVGGPTRGPWVRCYRASVDGFNSTTDFHWNCDHRGPTITVARTAHGFVVGAYASVPFRRREDNVMDPNAFLFAFSGPNDRFGRKRDVWAGDLYTLADYSGSGPSFGTADLQIPGDIRSQMATSELGNSFSGTGSLAGITPFRILDVEVFSLGNVSDALCFGVSANSINVCSGRGRCVAPNTCVCNPGWSGPQCTIPICFGFSALDSAQVCSGKGTCTSANTCSCFSGYAGLICELNQCFGVNEASLSICRGSGRCTGGPTARCECADGYTGIQCELATCKFEPLDVTQSTILNSTQRALVASWVGTNDWSLCWRASRHGSAAQAFHVACDGKGRTVTIVKSKNGNIFGGYASVSWSSVNGYINDPASFIFTVHNHKGLPPHKFNKTSNNGIYDAPTFGPSFGDNDFAIGDKSTTSMSSYVHLATPRAHTSTIVNNIPVIGSTLFTTSTTIQDFEVLVTVPDAQSLEISNSTVLNEAMMNVLRNWTSTFSATWVICYRSSTHQGLPATFHSRCDNKGRTITVIRTTSNHVLGAYTFLPFSSRNGYITDVQSTLFSLVNPHSLPPFKATIKPSTVSYGFYDHPTSFPSFGYDWAPDLKITTRTSFSMQPNCFDYEEGRSSFLAGSTGFLVDDVEVFVLPASSTSSSALLSLAQQSQIATFVGRPFSDFSLCYRASEHGYHGYAFHKKCDFKAPTVTVIRTHAGVLFGGYTQIPWDYRVNGFITDPNSLVFSLTGPRGAIKVPAVNSNQLFMSISSGPNFGSDISINDNFNLNIISTRMTNYVNNLYPVPSLFLFGSSSTTMTDMEVYCTTSSAITLLTSTVIDTNDKNILSTWTGRAASQWFRCYKATLNGWSPSTFRSNCNNKGASITLYIVGSNIFGGYTSLPWQSTASNRADPNAFVFTLRNPSGTPRTRAVLRNPSVAIYDHSSSFPCFGSGGTDISTSSATINTAGFGTTYEFPEFDPNAMLAGTRDFFISEVEVFALRNSEPIPLPSLLNTAQISTVAGWVGFPANQWTLCYKSESHGFSSHLFHEKCDNRGRTFVVARSTNGGIVGAYTSKGFLPLVQSTFITDPYAFLFTLTNSKNLPSMQFPVSAGRVQQAVLQDANRFFTFGSDDFILNDNPNNWGASAALSNGYMSPDPSIVYQERFLMGGSSSTLSDLEIYTTTSSPTTMTNSTITTNTTALNLVLSHTGRALSSWFLCYRRSRDGTVVATFRSNCAGKGSSVLLARNTAGHIFGGYTQVGWNALNSLSVNGYITDNNAYIFSVVNPFNQPPQRATLVGPSHAIYDHFQEFPRFGGGHDLSISASTTTAFPSSYDFRNVNSRYFVDGTFNAFFSVSSIEAYYLPPIAAAQGALLDEQKKQALQRWIGLRSYSWEPCYKATLHGFQAPQFHAMCDAQGPTITVINTTAGVLLGGYLSTSWMFQNGWQYDSSAFLYTFFPYAQQSPVKYHHTTNNFNSALNGLFIGPTFGASYDLFVSDMSNTNFASYNNPSSTYATLVPGLPANGLTGGTYSFKSAEIEVYKLGSVPCAASCFNVPFSNPSVCSGHGTCNPPDNCTCDTGYTGLWCQFAICYEVSAQFDHVCSFRNGTCSSPNNCVCNSGYTGAQCQIPICNGRLATDSNVCSGRGTCGRANTCNCAPGYAGPDCQFFMCHGVSGGSPSVCSGRGSCTNINQCTCTSIYSGQQCEVSWCYSLPSTNTSVCSGNGVCSAIDTCTCSRGYMGSQCEIPICYGIMGNAPGVCSGGRGICTKRDTCECAPGYLEFKCQTTSCFGVFSNSSEQCSGHGQCSGFNRCACDYGYAGTACNETACFTRSFRDSSVCSGRGTCVGIDQCVCASNGFLGLACEVNGCFGRFASDPNVCNGRGTCVGANTCQCNPSWTGSQCQIPICYGKNATDVASVCSGHGTCSAPNTCTCSVNYSGQFCNLTTCSSVANTNPSVCNSRGFCTEHNRCTCTAMYWGGDNCQTRLYVPTCYGINGESASVCNMRNGTCLTDNNCACNEGYFGQQCNIAACFGMLSNHSEACSSNGTCVRRNTCACRNGFYGQQCENWNCSGIRMDSPTACSARGRCVAPNSCSCPTGWTGLNCEIPICYNKPATSTDVCSDRNGTCSQPNTCLCNAGYQGAECEIPQCYGSAATSTTVCSRRNGTCVNRDTCICNIGYHGSQCEIPICYGTSASSSSVCSFMNGTCTSRDNCVCHPNYVGERCQIPVCFGLEATNSRTCNGNGTCVRANSCSCRSGYYGSQCEWHNCNGLRFDNSAVCSGHGSCLSPNLCECRVGYTGDNCQIPICYGALANQSNVCTFGNGTCVAPNNCVCSSGYIGNDCSVPLCYGFSANDSRVCSQSNGTCTRRNNCVCNDGYVGTRCEVPVCYGISATNSQACRTNGTCIRADMCACNSGFYGQQCENYDCNGIPFNSAAVCSSHGYCARPNSCICQNGYTGVNCDIAICYGLLANDSRVCSQLNGTCSAPNVCTCHSGYTGVRCEIPICYGHQANQQSVCSSRNGTCVRQNTCICNLNYVDNECQTPLCFGLRSDHSRVCHGNGTCIRANTCTCATGYYGTECQNHNCYGLRYDANSVCSSHGMCISPDSCRCQHGWVGAQCNVPVCFGILGNNSAACGASNGTCTKPDFCVCSNGYTGSKCDIPVCFNYAANETEVCSMNGTCLRNNTCQCNAGYTGANCETPICFTKLATESTSCSGNGSCILHNTCRCNAGYYGSECQHWSCYGVHYENSSVCSNNGWCISPEICACKHGWVGSQCDIPICYGLRSTNNQVCSARNGTCTSPDNCMCNTGYIGNRCEIPVCFGISANRTEVCSRNNGTCLSRDNCYCREGYTGQQCEIPICYTIPASSGHTCSGHGSCINHNKCICEIGYTGINCNIPICFGVNATNNTVCSRQGTCLDYNTCACNISYYGENCELFNCNRVVHSSANVCSHRNGTCTAPNTCNCNIGYTGLNCETPICFDRLATEINVCSGKGRCTRRDNCECISGYTGVNCQIPICYGHRSIDNTTCSNRNGSCVQRDTCVCNSNYMGTECEVAVCFGVPRTSGNSCLGRGTCVAANTCRCRTEYYGVNCELYNCFDVPFTNMTRVCSGHGTCIGPNSCVCAAGWTGLNCETPICYNRPATLSSVCNHRNGTCVQPNRCECSSGYTGFDCSVPICFNRTGSAACSGRGVCMRNNTCNCMRGYGSSQCERVTCNGLFADNSMVCSGHGACAGPDMCRCASGFSGFNCQFRTCSGFLETDPMVCSGRGACAAPNNCSCGPQYIGTNCETLRISEVSCFGLAASDNNVCSGNGTCIGSNRCICRNGYGGLRCDAIMCFNISNSDTLRVCSGHGTCTATDTCSCRNGYGGVRCEQFTCFANATSNNNCLFGWCVNADLCMCRAGYTGTRCNISVCYGVRADSPNVCSGSGICLSPNLCGCNNGTTGIQCETTSCFGKASFDRTVCSGHGRCISADTCSCMSGYTGNVCNIPSCYGKLANDPSVCNGEGECISPNTCRCNNTRKGGDCSACIRTFTGSNCERSVCDNSLTCNNNGVCDMRTLNCSCFASQATGYWRAPLCDTCALNYVGAQCNIFCSSLRNCSGHGSCSDDGSCHCFDDDVRGHWTSSNCSQCMRGYYGARCATSATNFTFMDSADRMQGVYTYEQRFGRRQIACSELFEASTIRSFGIGARCWWPNPFDQVMEVIFGERASLMPGTYININMLPFSARKEYQMILVNGPANPVTPRASLKSPPLLGVCDDVPLDAAASNSPDRRSLRYSWTAISGYRLEQLNAFLSLQTLPFIAIPSDFIEPLFDYVISVTVTSFLNMTSNPASITVTKLGSGVPVVSIDGPRVQYATQTQQRFVVTGQVKMQKCRASNMQDITTVWRQTMGAPTKYEQRNTDLVISSFPFSSFTYTIGFSFQAFRSAQPGMSSQTDIFVIVSPAKLSAIISGGTNRSLTTSQALELDGSLSSDPANSNATAIYRWVCIDQNTRGFCSFANAVTTMMRDKLVVPANSLRPGSYVFTLTFAKDARIAEAAVRVTYVEPQEQFIPPVVSFAISHQRIHKNIGRVSARSSVTMPGAVLTPRLLTYQWSLTEATGERRELANTSVAASARNEPVFAFATRELSEGLTYVLRLAVNLTNSMGRIVNSFVSHEFNVTEAPFVGIFLVYPEEGTAMETEFNLNCQQFTTDNPPLQYSFGYLDTQNKLVPLSFFSQSNLLGTTLPHGRSHNNSLTLVATVRDSIGAILTVQRTIAVRPPLFMRGDRNTTEFQPRNNSVLSAVSSKTSSILNATVTSDRENSALIAQVNVLLELLNDDSPQSIQPTAEILSTSSSSTSKNVKDDTCPTVVDLECPNNCSSFGMCVNGQCVCQGDRRGRDCRYTEQELREREVVRFNMLLGVFQAITVQLENNNADVVAVNQLAILCQRLTAIYEEVSPESQKLVVSFLLRLVQTSAMNEDIATILMQTISNIGLSMQTRVGTISDLVRFNVSQGMIGASESLLRRIAMTKETGEKPTIFNAATLSSVMYKTYRDSLSSQLISLCNTGGKNQTSAEVAMPTVFYSATNASQSAVPEEVNVKFISFRQNPYFWSNSSQNISSDVLRIDLLTSDGENIKLRELIEPIAIKLPIKDLSLFTRNFSEVQWICKYWNETAHEWRSDGCKVANVSSQEGTVVCHCNHTTDFSVFLENILLSETIPSQPKTPVPPLIEQLLSYNWFTSVSMLVVFLIFVFILVMAFVLESLIGVCALTTKKNDFSSLDTPKEVQSTKLEKSRFRRILTALLNSYLLLSLFVPSKWTRNILYQAQAELHKIEKVFVVYIGTCVMLAIQAVMEFSNRACAIEAGGQTCNSILSQYGWLINSIGAAIAASIVYRLLAYLLIKTTPRSLRRIQTELVLAPQYSKYQEAISQEFDLSMDNSANNERPSTPNLLPMKVPVFRDSVTPPTPTSPKVLLPSTPSSRSLLSTNSTHSQVEAANMFNKMDHIFNSIYTILFVGNAAKRFAFGCFFFTLATLVYGLLSLGFAITMHFMLPFENYWTLFVVMGGMITAWLIYMQSVYFQLKYELRNRINGYYIVSLLFACALVIVSLIMAIGGTTSIFFVPKDSSFYAGLSSIATYCLVACSVFFFIGSFVLFWKAKRTKIANDDDNSDSAVTIYWFPSWFSLIVYCAGVAVLIASHVIAIMFGLNFDNSRGYKWLYSALVSFLIDQVLLTLLVAAHVSLVQPCLRLVIKDYLRSCN